MSIYAANNIAKAVARLSRQAGSRLSGIICNSRGRPDFERAVLGEFSQRLGLGPEVVGFIPRSDEILACEVQGRTVMEGEPDSAAAEAFRALASRVVEETGEGVVPTPLELDELETLYRETLARTGGAAGAASL